MGDYNADPDPDLSKITMIAHGFNIAPLVKLKIDQFSTLDSTKVYSFVQKSTRSRLRIKVNPTEIPGI